MTHAHDPFRHHPELRAFITPAEASFFRTFTADKMIEAHPELGHLRSWVFSDATREAIRAQSLAEHQGDLWVFAYGSLMWDPALKFREVRRAYAPHHARYMILQDDKGGRGTQEAPGLMAALDHGAGCHGLAFNLAEADVDGEIEILFRREVIAPGYIPQFIPVQTDIGTRQALTFLADHAVPEIVSDISRAAQVHSIATGVGILGSSRAYLANIVEHFDLLGIDDPECRSLLAEADALIERGVL